MKPYLLLIIISLICLVTIAICSFIINVLNQIGDNINGTEYKKLTGDNCKPTILAVDEAKKWIDITRSLAIIPLILTILLLTIIIVGVIIIFVSGKVDILIKDIPGNPGFIIQLLTNKWIYFLIILALFFIFLGFIVVYAIALNSLNEVDISCFTGSKLDEKSPLGKFEKAKSIITYQLIVCSVMAGVFLLLSILIIYAIISGNRKKTVGKQQAQQNLIKTNPIILNNLNNPNKKQ
jgi:hypothetical protein